MRTRAKYSELQVRDVTVKVGEKIILHNVNTRANSGDLLAVLGPTGSGKTTLLNVISGRLKATSGEVTLNGEPFSKRLRRKLAFVQQQDVFFSQLTLYETLYFTARLRLPESLSEAEKKQKIDDIVNTLDMKKCLHTVIGDIFVRGLSGGEKKRASIACELLTDPDLLLMDEPTSGLDSSTALTLMQQMKVYANHYNKTIVTTIHQPSSQIYHMFDNILLLINGNEAYYGPGKGALVFFEECVGLYCEPHFNPADFILQVAKSDEETVAKVIEAAKKRCQPFSVENTVVKKSNDTGAISYDVDSDMVKVEGKQNGMKVPDQKTYAERQDDTGSEVTAGKKVDTKVLLEKEPTDVTSTLIDTNDYEVLEDDRTSRWPTSWFTQYYMLSWRSFKQTKGNLLQGYAIIQTVIVTLVVGVIYWQIEQNMKTIRDVMGLLFFSVSYWTFNPAFEAISTYPAEKGVIAKERGAGSYRLSAYYVAKMTSDLPLALILPTMMYVVIYSMSGVGGVPEFFMTYVIIILQVLLSQGFGFAIGVAFNGEIKPAFTAFASYTLCSFMIGGFFTQNVPSWMTWAKYCSTILYPFGAVTNIIFRQYPTILCNETSIELFPQCESNSTQFINYKDILDNAGINLPIYFYIFPIFLIITFFRVTGYFLLKYRRPKLL